MDRRVKPGDDEGRLCAKAHERLVRIGAEARHVGNLYGAIRDRNVRAVRDVVEVTEEDGERGLAALRRLQSVVDSVHEQGPVRESGDVIVKGAVLSNTTVCVE